MKNLLLILLSSSFLVVAQAQTTSVIDTLSYPGIIEFLDENANSDDPAMIVRLSLRAQSFAEEEFGKNSNEYLDLVMFEATAWKELGDIPRATESAGRVLSVAQAVLDTNSVRYGEVLMVQGDVHFATGKLDSIRHFYQLAKQRFPKDHTGYMVCLTQLGVVSLHLGDLSAGMANFEESVGLTRKQIVQLRAVPEEDRDDSEIINTEFALIGMMANLGIAYVETGYTQNALEVLEEAIDRILTVADKDHPYYSAIVVILSQVYSNIGQRDKAIAFGLESVALMSQPGKEHLLPRRALYTLNLARQYKGDNQQDTALVYVKQALELFNEGGEIEAKNFARGQLLLGKIYYDLERYDDAIAATEEGLNNLKTQIGDDNTFYIEGEITLADVYAAQGKYQQSLSLLTKIKKGLDNGYRSNFAFYGGVLSDKAIIHEQLGELAAAAVEFTESNELIEQNIDLNLYFLPESDQLAFVKEASIVNDEMLSFNYRHPDFTTGADVALTNHLQLKGIVLGGRKKMIEKLRSTENETLRKQFEQWSVAVTGLAAEYAKKPEEQTDLDSLKAIAYALETELSRNSATFRNAQEKVGWREVQAELSEGEVVIEFAHFRYRNDQTKADGKHYAYVAQIIKEGTADPITVPLFFAKDLPRLRATKQLYAFPKAGGKTNLHQLLYQPLAEHLTEAATIYFSPAGALHRINLGAIPITEKENMSDRFQLHQIGSAKEVSILKNQAAELAKSAIVFGGIDYAGMDEEMDQAAGTGSNLQARGLTDEEQKIELGDAYRSLRENEWPFLENTGREAAMVKGSLRNSDFKVAVYTGQEASEEVFKQLGVDAPSPRIIHLATHGFFFPSSKESGAEGISKNGFENAKHPLVRSGLILAGGNQTWRGEKTAGEDGILTAYEIAQMDLSNTELVVLSACDTGLGDIEGNEGVFGLQRALKLAGAKYVLMSLWNVKDEKTYEFMTVFYGNIQKGVAIPLAYQRAQSNLRRKYALPFNPRNWAGFVLLE